MDFLESSSPRLKAARPCVRRQTKEELMERGRRELEGRFDGGAGKKIVKRLDPSLVRAYRRKVQSRRQKYAVDRHME